MGKSAVIYARYSSDLQHERSIDDQVRLCRQLADSRGLDVVEVYADYAISGSHLRSRPSALRLMEDAKSGRFSVVVAEALDRISRDQEDTAAIYKRLSFGGVRMVTQAEGDITEMHVGLASTMSAMFLKGLATKIRRGQEGQALKGMAAGGLSYGYRVVREMDARGEPIRGKRAIDDEQAEVVRRIFREFAAGASPRTIAADLNRDHIAAPFGGLWRASAINGNRARGTGILWNQAYIGLLVYNRVTMVKDPDSGKRLSRVNPASKWVVTQVPEWRIIDDELWDSAQGLKRAASAVALHQQRRPKRLLSGLTFCGLCGGAYTIRSRDQLGCCTHREAGACSNGHVIRVSELERRILAGIKGALVDPDRIAKAMCDYRAERKRQAGDRAQRVDSIDRRLVLVNKEIERLVDAVAQVGWSAAIGERLAAAEAEKGALTAERVALACEKKIVDLHPGAIEAYRQAIGQLEDLLDSDPEARSEAMSIFRPFVRRIEIFPEEKRGETRLMLHGALPEMISLARRLPGEAVRTVMMVAGEGLEPPTPGL